MSLFLKLTFWEIRSSWKRLIFFFVCIAIGVGSVVTLRSLTQNFQKAAAGDARALLTADIEVSSTNDFSPEEISRIEEIVSNSPIVEARNEVITTSSVVRPDSPDTEGIVTAELKGIEDGFPLVGKFTLSDGTNFSPSLLANNGAIVAPLLLESLNLKVGDKIRIGSASFEIRGTFQEEPGGTGGFRLGPRIFLERKAFDDSGLTRAGSRIRRRILYRTSENPTELVSQLRSKLKGTIVTVQSYRETQQNLGEQFERIENYLALAGLLILVLGGIGVWNVARVFIEQKRKAIAVLKCLGAGSGIITLSYLSQIGFLSVCGSLFGILLSQLSLWMIEQRFSDSLPAGMSFLVGRGAMIQGVLLGSLVSILFSLLPALQIRSVKPILLLRDRNNAQVRRLDWRMTLVALFSLGCLLAVSAWQAGSIRIGAFFMLGLAVTAFILYLAAAGLTVALKKVSRTGSFAVKQAVNSIYRPGNQTRIILLAVGLGVFVVLSVLSLQRNLVGEFDFANNRSLPSIFIADVQRSEATGLKEMVAAETGEAVEPIPTIRARISLINGEPFDYEQKEIRQQQGQIGREFAVTYRPRLDTNETITDGAFWGDKGPDYPEVSVEEGMARTLKIRPGDYITFDVMGRKINTLVTSIRRIDVRNTRTAFIFVFSPGVLEKAPHTFAIPLTTKLSQTERDRFKRKVLTTFPNVQLFDVADILSAVGKLLDNFVTAISFIGGFIILSGILILVGSVSLSRSQRLYENAVLKTLGANRRDLLTIIFTEYFLLGLLSGVIGTGFAMLLSYLVSKFVLDISWRTDLLLPVLGIAITAMLVTITGVLACFNLLRSKPLSILRSE